MMSVELKHHPEEWFFLHNFDIDKVFSTIQRADYLILYYIKMQAEQHPDSKVYLADLAAVMGLKVTELSKAVEKLQDNGFVAWKTDREAVSYTHLDVYKRQGWAYGGRPSRPQCPFPPAHAGSACS